MDIHRGSRKGNKTPEGNTLWGTKDQPSINYGREYSVIPDYLNDLNAMHEAEKRLRTPRGDESNRMAEDRMVEYAERLNYCIDATAPQRAEAFLRTLNLWID